MSNQLSSVKRVKLVLLGYRMEVNGKPHMRLSPATQSCTLVKCKAGKKYKVVLVALTCPSTVLRSRRKDVRKNFSVTIYINNYFVIVIIIFLLLAIF